MTRHGAEPTPTRTTRMGIAAKLGLVMAAMTVITALVATVLFVQLRQVTTTYDGILSSQVRAASDAREMQVEFKKQVQEWKDILLRGFTPADLATYTTQFHAESATVDRLGNALLTTAPDAATRDDVQQFLTEHATLDQNYEAALAPFVAAGAKDPTVPDRAVRGQDRPPTDRIDGIVARLETAVTDRVAAQNASVAHQQRVLTVVGLLALLLLLGTLAFVVAGIVRPIRVLTAAAYQAAHQALPDAIGKIRRTPGDSPPQLPAVQVRSRDELRDLAAALSSMQDSAVALAFDQHRAERAAADILVNLGRRNQSLLKRTLGYITELEADESDPDVLSRLFRLDHATTRIRRNAESMLVIAGAEQTRTWSRPVPVADVVRAALSEIEDYARVDPHHVEDAALTGTSVADVVHLIAELTENATHFSPPNSGVVVVGQRLPDGYRLRVIDRGIGMTATELAAANARIGQAVDERGDSPLLGLYVVGRLAARHGIAVELEPSAGVGITATITFPAGLLVRSTPPAGQQPEIGTPASGTAAVGGAPDAAADAPTTTHRIPIQVAPATVTAAPSTAPPPPVPPPAVPPATVPPATVRPPTIPRPRSPRPVMALAGAGTAVPHADRGAPSPAPPWITDPRALPAMPEPRGRSWVVPPDAESARPGTITSWFHALADPVPEPQDPGSTGTGSDSSGSDSSGSDSPGSDSPGSDSSGSDSPGSDSSASDSSASDSSASDSSASDSSASDSSGSDSSGSDGPDSGRSGSESSGSGSSGSYRAEPLTRPDDAPIGPAGIPRRIRGAQLPDLGDARSGQEFAAPDPDQVRRQLSALHLGVERAQAEQRDRS